MPQGAQKGRARQAISGNRNVVSLDRRWLTPTVLSLARAAYEERDRSCLACNRWTDCAYCKNARRLPTHDGTLDPARLMVLSDALEEAGADGPCVCCRGNGRHRTGLVRCDSDGIHDSRQDIVCLACGGNGRAVHPLVAHLRAPGPHVRGCWAVDCVLDKS